MSGLALSIPIIRDRVVWIELPAQNLTIRERAKRFFFRCGLLISASFEL
jgi:hypothetical protein